MVSLIRSQSTSADRRAGLVDDSMDDAMIAASAEAQIQYAISRASAMVTAFLHDKFSVVGFVEVTDLVDYLHQSSVSSICTNIVPLLVHSHGGYVKVPKHGRGAPTLDESMVVNASRSVYQADRYIALTSQVLAVAFCPSIDTRSLHRTVTTAQFSAAFLKNLDDRTTALITTINREDAATASRDPAYRNHI